MAAGEYIDGHSDDAEIGTATAQLCLVMTGGWRGALAGHCLDAPVQQRVVVENLRRGMALVFRHWLASVVPISTMLPLIDALPAAQEDIDCFISVSVPLCVSL